MIGLVDLNFQKAEKSLPPPNLEIMKLAEYYKREENKYCRLINLEETEFGGYEKIYVFSENDDCITVPETIKRAPNVIYGGSAFTNKVYVPFENELIDYTLPRPNIYSNLLKEKYQAGELEKNIEHILDDGYYRRFAGEKELPIPPINTRKRVYIYDRDFFQAGWQTIIEDIKEHKPSSINFIHPAHYYKLSDFFCARENDIISKSNDAFLDLNIPLSEVNYMMRNYQKRLLSLILPTSAIYLSIGGSYYYQMEYYKNFIYKLNLLYNFWAYKIPIRLKYEKPTLGCYDPLANLSKTIAAWSSSSRREHTTIYEYFPKKTTQEEIKAAKEEIKMLVDKYPKQDILFKQTKQRLQEGGKWTR